MTTKLLRLDGNASFTSPRTYGVGLRQGQVCQWRDEDAVPLLSLAISDAAGTEVKLFTEVFNVTPLHDFTNKYRNDLTIPGPTEVVVNPASVASVKPVIPRGTTLKDSTGVAYGYSDGAGGYIEIPTAANVKNASINAVAASVPPTPRYLTDRIASDNDSASFLQKATFGPTLAEITALTALGSRKAWVIDQLSRTSAKRFVDYVYVDLNEQDFPEFSNIRATDSSIITPLIVDPAALRMKAIWSLSKLFVVSWPGGAFDDPGTPYNYVSWFDRLDKYVFGNWRDLIESITYSLHMSRMLTFYANEKSDGRRQPDENYAREIMQLFTIGLWELNPDGTRKKDDNGKDIPTYSLDDVRQVARCMTGLTRWDFNGTSQRYDSDDPNSRAMFLSSYNTAAGVYHFSDPDYRLRHYLPAYEYGAKYALGGLVDIPDGTDPVTNLTMLHDALFNHPNTAPFFAQRMIQHFVTSNPSPAYVRRVAAAFENNGKGVRGDLKAVWAAILLDPEAAQDGRVDSDFGRVRDGFDLWAAHHRSLARRNQSGYLSIAADGSYGTYVSNYGNTAPRMAPSIFGFYDPTHEPLELKSKGLLSPELMMWSNVQTVRALNHLSAVQAGHEPRDAAGADTSISDYSMLPLAGTADALIDRLSILLCGGKLSASNRANINSVISTMPVTNATEQQNRATLALQLVLNSPDYWVQL